MLMTSKLINICSNLNNNLKMNFYKINIFLYLLYSISFINIKSNFNSASISVSKTFIKEKLGPYLAGLI